MITDGQWACRRCGEWRVVCQLCVGMPEDLVFVGHTAKQIADDREAERELDRQSRAIADAAWKRSQP